MAKAEEQLSVKAAPSITMTTGGTFEHFYSIPQSADLAAPVTSREVPGILLDTNIADDIVKLRYANTGAVAQMQYTVTPAIALTLGARGDYNTRYGATFNPRIGIVGQPHGSTTLKLMYGTAFLAPSPYEAYEHFGSFYSTDGGRTFASSFWHVANPDLKPQQERTVEFDGLQALGTQFHLTASAFYARFTDLVEFGNINPTAGGGTYRGWPVDSIEITENEGRRTSYGASAGLAFLHTVDEARRIEAHAGLAVVDGREIDEPSVPAAPIGGMVPVQFRLGADVDWYRWSLAPRLSVLGRQRTMAMAAASMNRRTIDGYVTVDVNLRRQRVFKNLDAFVTIENAFDRRYRALNINAYTNPAELNGMPQNPRRVTVGFDLRLK